MKLLFENTGEIQMKHLLESWRKMLEGGDVSEIPTNMNMADIYSSFQENLEDATEELKTIRDLFENKGFDLQNIKRNIELLDAILKDKDLKYDVENF